MLKSIGENIIVSSVKNNEYERNGIIVKTNNNSNIIGNVVSVGEDVKEIKVEDKVLYSDNNARKILYENAEYYVLSEKNVLAII